MVHTAFSKLRENLELGDTLSGLVEQRHTAIRSALKNIDPSLESKLLGSLQRKTRIHPRKGDKFDIDILAVMGAFNVWLLDGSGVTAVAALQRADNILNESKRYSAMGPRIDAPTVTFDYEDSMKVEIVPAYVNNIGHDAAGKLYPVGRGYWVAKVHGWEFADYDEDAKTLSRLNAECDQVLVPTIKMLRAVRREFFSEMIPFHVEIIAAHVLPVAIAINTRYGVENTYPQLLRDFFASASAYLDAAYTMPGGLGTPIILDVKDRENVRHAFDVLKRYCEATLADADPAKQVEGWRTLFPSLIPQDVYA